MRRRVGPGKEAKITDIGCMAIGKSNRSLTVAALFCPLTLFGKLEYRANILNPQLRRAKLSYFPSTLSLIEEHS